ncbi:hypothetical protein Gpo141_00014915, partial [Globisporangium polare]
MSNFTDDEDRQLVQLAASLTSCGSVISWDRLAAHMPRSSRSKSKEELRQRLKTLKRTHGRDLRKFPPWFFRKQCVSIARSERRCSKGVAAPPKR